MYQLSDKSDLILKGYSGTNVTHLSVTVNQLRGRGQSSLNLLTLGPFVFLREPQPGLQPHHELQWPPAPLPLNFDLTRRKQSELQGSSWQPHLLSFFTFAAFSSAFTWCVIDSLLPRFPFLGPGLRNVSSVWIQEKLIYFIFYFYQPSRSFCFHQILVIVSV